MSTRVSGSSGSGSAGAGGEAAGVLGSTDGIEYLVSVEAPEIRVAEVRAGRLWGLDVDRGGRLLGDVFIGRVSNVLPGMDAAFVDIGLEHNALLYDGDVVPAGARLRVGQEIVVQVVRPPSGSKGARVSMALSLPGRYVVLSEGGDGVGVSRRLVDGDERARLRRLADRLRPLDHGLVVRTEAEGASEAALAADVKSLAELLGRIRSGARALPPPTRLHRDLGILGRLARDRLGDSVTRVVLDDAATLDELREAVRAASGTAFPAPRESEALLELYQAPPASPAPLFRAAGIEKDLERALARVVPLPSGGSLAVDEAEALTAIDVNSGRFTGRGARGAGGGLAETVLQVNLEAVQEAARQMRLRNVGGLAVIDFIDMERTRDRVRVLDALEAALAQDRARTRIVQLSPSGLVEITRQREGPSLRAALHRPCPYCSGRGVVRTPQTVAIETRRRLRERAVERARESQPGNPGIPPGRVLAVLHPESACALLEAGGAYVRAVEEECGLVVYVRVDFGMHLEAARLSDASSWGGGGEGQDGDGGGPLHSLAPRLVQGERAWLPAATPLYPSEDPIYAVLHNQLVRLEGPGLPIDAARAATTRALLVEVASVERWFATAHSVPAPDAPPS